MPFLVALSEIPAPAGGMDGIIGAMDSVISMLGKVMDAITSQPLLLFLLAAGLVPVIIGVFVHFKRASR